MRIQDLMEERIADALPQLIANAKSLIELYSDTLPFVVKQLNASVDDPYDTVELGMVNRAINACKLRIGSLRSKWFTDNYMSVSKDRGTMSRAGLKNALVNLSKVPQLQRIESLRHLAHLNVNINPNQKVDKTSKGPDINSYGELMGNIELHLPDIIKRIAKVAKPEDLVSSHLSAEEIYQIGERLAHVIKSWERMKGSIPKPYEGAATFKKQGDALITKEPTRAKGDVVRPQPKPEDNRGQQNAQVQDLIQQVLSQVEPHIAKVVGPAISKVPIENRLAALRSELAKHGEKMESMFESMFE